MFLHNNGAGNIEGERRRTGLHFDSSLRTNEKYFHSSKVF